MVWVRQSTLMDDPARTADIAKAFAKVLSI